MKTCGTHTCRDLGPTPAGVLAAPSRSDCRDGRYQLAWLAWGGRGGRRSVRRASLSPFSMLARRFGRGLRVTGRASSPPSRCSWWFSCGPRMPGRPVRAARPRRPRGWILPRSLLPSAACAGRRAFPTRSTNTSWPRSWPWSLRMASSVSSWAAGERERCARGCSRGGRLDCDLRCQFVPSVSRGTTCLQRSTAASLSGSRPQTSSSLASFSRRWADDTTPSVARVHSLVRRVRRSLGQRRPRAHHARQTRSMTVALP
jgi:hypothetical protein